MNCKKGDLAIVVSSIVPNSPNIGKIVRCLEFVPTSLIYAEAGWVTDIDLIQYFVFDRTPAKQDKFVVDKMIRPIRDNDQEDETFAWAGKPEKATA